MGTPATPPPAPADGPKGDASALRLLPVAIDSLDHTAHNLDLYLKHGPGPKAALYRAAGVTFTADDAKRLAEQGVEFLFIPSHQHGAYGTALTARLDRMFSDKAVAAAERTRLVRQSTTRMLQEVLLLPGQPETVGLAQEVSKRFVSWAEGDRGAFGYLLDMSARNLSAAAHMVNVGLGCGMLYAELLRKGGPGDPAETALYHQGGLLHDIGQRDIPEAVLNKEGKLTEEEWRLVRRHPLNGFQELLKVEGTARIVLQMVRDHHERLDGQGYPACLTAERIGLPARICAVVDIFDSITTARPHRKPIPPLEALKTMAHGVGQYFDPVVFNAWRELVERMLGMDPARAPRTGGATASPARLSELVPTGSAAAAAPACHIDASLPVTPVLPGTATPPPMPPPPGNRRRYKRVACAVSVEASFVRRLKQDPKAPAGPLTLLVSDISQSGMKVQTPSPLSLNDVLLLKLPGKDGTITEHHARVVRVRRGERDTWVAGLCFIAPEAGMQPGKAAAA